MRSSLAQSVLPLIRSRLDLHQHLSVSTPGRQIPSVVEVLEKAVGTGNPAVVFDVTQRGLDAAVRVIARADDFSGNIGHACRRLLDQRPRVSPVRGATVPAVETADAVLGDARGLMAPT